MRNIFVITLFGLSALGLITGCQQSAETGSSAQANGDNTSKTDAGENRSVVASIPNPDAQKPDENLPPVGGFEFVDTKDEDPEDVEDLGAREGTPEWYLREIARLRLEAPTAPTDDVEALRKARVARNQKILDLAAEAIKLTHQSKEPREVRLFEVAVHYMLESRLELALQGDRESIDALYDDAASLWERDPKSKAAADAAFTLVSLAYSSAKAVKSSDNKWLVEFARQATNFSKNFPQEERRGLTTLFAAARSCELYGLNDLAIKAYKQLQESYPQSEPAAKVKSIVRRLELPGKAVKLGGPTIDGGFLRPEDIAGKATVLVFWEAKAKPFAEELTLLKELQSAYQAEGLQIVGVCLDEDQTVVEQFTKLHKIAWPQIFYSETGKRGWKNPIASYYGIQEVGYWLIDSQGVVVSTSAKPADLDRQLSPLLKRGISRLPNSPPR